MKSDQVCWSTGDVAHRQSLEYWNTLFADNVLRLDISSHARDHFIGRMVGADLGRDRVYYVAAESDQKVDHGRACVAQRGDDSLCLVHIRCGGFHFETQGRSVDLMVGDCMLLDSKQLFRFSLPNSSAALILRITADWLRRWIPKFEDVAGIRIDGSRGWGQTLSHALSNVDPMHVAEVTIPRQSRGPSFCEPLKAAVPHTRPSLLFLRSCPARIRLVTSGQTYSTLSLQAQSNPLPVRASQS